MSLRHLEIQMGWWNEPRRLWHTLVCSISNKGTRNTLLSCMFCVTNLNSSSRKNIEGQISTNAVSCLVHVAEGHALNPKPKKGPLFSAMGLGFFCQCPLLLFFFSKCWKKRNKCLEWLKTQEDSFSRDSMEKSEGNLDIKQIQYLVLPESHITVALTDILLAGKD